MKVILKKIKNSICTLTINRPDQYNALNQNILIDLDNKLDWVISRSQARVVIITGSGNKAFIAGADIKDMYKMDSKEAKLFSKMGQNLTTKIEKFKIPVIAAVNGFALGGGCELAMACHIRYASTNAVFGQPEVGLGLIAGWGGTQRLPRLVGKGKAMEILLSGNNISATAAESIGLVNKVVDSSDLIRSVEELAKAIIKNSPLALDATIKAINFTDDDSLRNGLINEQTEFSNLFNTNDTKEGLSAFLDKRNPDFTGK